MKRALLDENLPRPLVRYFSDQLEVLSVHDLGWDSKKNGELIAAMLENEIEYLITVDKNLEYQQNLKKYPIKLIVLLTYSNRLKLLRDKMGKVESHILEMPHESSVIHIDLRD